MSFLKAQGIYLSFQVEGALGELELILLSLQVFGVAASYIAYICLACHCALVHRQDGLILVVARKVALYGCVNL